MRPPAAASAASCGVLNPSFPHSLDHARASTVAISLRSSIKKGEAAATMLPTPRSSPLAADCPAGGENPQGFHPFVNLSPILAGNQRSAPAGGENPAGFSSLCESHIPDAKHIPDANLPLFWPRNRRQAGRIPPYGGCASPSGAQCRHKGVFCLPGTMPDRGGRNK
ncbi:MAG: hypothetical protein LBK61_02785 [Spirochaetaceae bacterium]|nr:hypothetical protein [Spirochaetaceae bacterium]